MVWIGILGGLFILIIIFLLLKVNTSIEITYSPQVRRFVMDSQIGVISFKALFLAVGGRKEASLTLALFSRRALVRFDIPIIKWSKKGLKPILKVFKEVEAGFNSAKPIKDGWERFSLSRLRLLFRQAIAAYSGLGPSFAYLLSKTTVGAVEITIEEGTGSAPSTAIVSGALWGCAESVMAFLSGHSILKSHPRVQISPNFNQRLLSVDAKLNATCYHFHLLKAIAISIPVIVSLLKNTKDDEKRDSTPNPGPDVTVPT